MWFVILKHVCLLMVLVCSCRVNLVTIDSTVLRFLPPNLSVLEGNNATLTCDISNSEDSVFYIVWKKQTAYVYQDCRVTGPLTNTQLYSVRCINEDVQITILHVTRVRHGEVWTCQRISSNTQYESSSTITVKVPITNVRIESQREYTLTKENTPTKFLCVTSVGYPEAVIRWYKNNTQLTNGDVSTSSTTSNTYLNVVRSNLTLYPTRTDNSSQINCAANNNDRSWQYSNRTSVIVYYYPDVPIITNGSRRVQGDLKVIEGYAINVTCTTSSFPEPNYSWATQNGSSMTGHRLLISNLSRNEDGQYKCKASNTMILSSGETYQGANTTSIIVSVLYPPTSPTFIYNNISGSIISGGIIKVIKGKSVKVVCNTTGNPVPVYNWHNTAVTSGQILEVKNVASDTTWTCRVTNFMIDSFGNHESGKAERVLSLEILYPPEVIQLKVNGKETSTNNNPASVVEGSNVTLSCDANSKPPPSTYTWYKLEPTMWQTASTGEYKIVRINRTHAGRYECHAEYVMNPSFERKESGNVSKDLSLEVLYPTKIDTFEVTGQRHIAVIVNEKDNITFVCKVDGKPASHVSILYGGQYLKQAIVKSTISHSVTNVTCVQHGQYTCAANNPYNRESAMRNLTLFVRCSPRPKPDSELQTVFASALGGNTIISFNVLAYPAPTENGFIWKKEIEIDSSWAELRNNKTIQISSSGLQSNLTLNNVSRSSFGNYRLHVKNIVGTYTHQFVLKVEDKPQSPTDFHHVEELATDSTLTFIWSPGFDGGPPQTFVLHYRKTNSKDEWLVQSIPDNGNPIMNTTLGFLTSSTMYDVYLIASNARGNSTAVVITAVQTRAAEEQAVGNRIITAVSGVTSSVVVICAIIILVVLYKRRQNQKESSKVNRATTTIVSRGVRENALSNSNNDANKDGADTKSSIYKNVPDLHLPSSATRSKQSSSKAQQAATPVPSATTNVSKGTYENVCSDRNDDAKNVGTDNKSNMYQNIPDLHLPMTATSSKQSSSKAQQAAAPSNVIYENLLLKAV